MASHYNRQMRLLRVVRMRNGTTVTSPEEVILIPDTSIVSYEYRTSKDDELVRVKVSRMSTWIVDIS